MLLCHLLIQISYPQLLKWLNLLLLITGHSQPGDQATQYKIGKVAPSLDGERVVQLGLQSHKFTVEEGSEFIEWLMAWMADKGIEA